MDIIGNMWYGSYEGLGQRMCLRWKPEMLVEPLSKISRIQRLQQTRFSDVVGYRYAASVSSQ